MTFSIQKPVNALHSPPTQGIRASMFVALLPAGVRTRPTDQRILAGIAGAAKAATAITLSGALTGAIQQNQFLLFTDPVTGAERIAQVSATTNSGATSLPVVALPQAIAQWSACEFPAYLWDRTAADVDRSYNLASLTTLDSGGDRDGVVTGKEKNLSAPGVYNYYNAGFQTARWAAENLREVWVKRFIGAPNAAFTQGELTEGAAVVTSLGDGVPTDGFVTADISFSFVGSVVEASAVPT